MKGKTHILDVRGELACFTRPEMKVERYSYPIITPSAARGIFDAIYFKVEHNFYWQIERVELLKPAKYIALRRNEVKDTAPNHNTILQWAQGKKAPEPLWADGTKDLVGSDQKGRTQRQTMALKNVHYRIHAHIHSRGKANLTGLDAQFERRAKKGKCFYQPYLGCREFPAWVELADGPATATDQSSNGDLGWMLYDVFDLNTVNNAQAKPAISVFKAAINNGVLEIPPYHSNAVKKSVEIADA